MPRQPGDGGAGGVRVALEAAMGNLRRDPSGPRSLAILAVVMATEVVTGAIRSWAA